MAPEEERSTQGRSGSAGLEEADAEVVALFRGRYEIHRRIGVGGLTLNFHASALVAGPSSSPPAGAAAGGRPGKPSPRQDSCTLALLPIDGRDRPEAADLVRNRMAAVVRLPTAGLVPVRATGMQNGIPFIELDPVAGQPLEDWLGERGGKIPCDEAASLVARLLAILAPAHATGISHWDLTPANIVVEATTREDGRRGGSNLPMVRVFGVGIAPLLAAARDSDATGPTGRGSGTDAVRYQAPELLLGGKADHRADLFALGMLLCRMVEGAVPSAVEDANLLTPAVKAVCIRAVASEPSQRFSSATEMGVALRDAAKRSATNDAENLGSSQQGDGDPIPPLHAAPTPRPVDAAPTAGAKTLSAPPGTSVPPHGRRRGLLTAPVVTSALVALALAGAIGVSLEARRRSREEPATSPLAMASSGPATGDARGRHRAGLATSASADDDPAPTTSAGASPPTRAPTFGAEPTELEEGAPGDAPAAPATPALPAVGQVADGRRGDATPTWQTPELMVLTQRAERGDRLTYQDLRPFTDAARRHAEDAGPQAALAHVFVLMRWYSDALDRYRIAFAIDRGARDTPVAIADLLVMVAHPQMSRPAERFIQQHYDGDLLPQIDTAIAAEPRAQQRRRLERLRERLAAR